jgi:Flp pilus assembly pilin Flp
LRDKRAATAVEYTLLASLIAAVVLAAFQALGRIPQSSFSALARSLGLDLSG